MYVVLFLSHICSGLSIFILGFPGGASGKEHTYQCSRHRRYGFSPWVGKIPLEEDMETHSSIPAWRTRWTEKSCGLQSIVVKSWTQLKQFACMHIYSTCFKEPAFHFSYNFFYFLKIYGSNRLNHSPSQSCLQLNPCKL